MSNSVYENIPLMIYDAKFLAESYYATVIDRDTEMIIEIPPQDGTETILLTGKRIDHYYAGSTELSGNNGTLIARWCKLGDVYVGIWLEIGVDALFSFRLPRKPTKGVT